MKAIANKLFCTASIVCMVGCSGGASNSQTQSGPPTAPPNLPASGSPNKVVNAGDICSDLSGTYRSTDKGIVPRTLKIEQTSCLEFKVTLKNGDDDTSPSVEAYKADNNRYNSRGAYDEASNSHPDDGSLASSSSSMFYRAIRTDAEIVIKHVWVFHKGFASSGCVEEVREQNACSVTETRYSMAAQDALLETQNGSTYNYGNMIPAYIHYSRVK